MDVAAAVVAEEQSLELVEPGEGAFWSLSFFATLSAARALRE